MARRRWCSIAAIASLALACRLAPEGGLDGSPRSIASLDAAANAGGLEGEIRVSFAVSGQPAPGDVVELRRVPGDVAPADCESGEVIAIDPAAGEATDRVADRWFRTHSYRACLVDAAGQLLDDEATAEAVRYHNPAPGCSHPPCTPVSSTVATGGLLIRGPSVSSTESTGGDALLADIDGDDDLDAIIAADGVNRVHHNDGFGGFGAAEALSPTGLTSVAAVAGDFDNDGIKDIAFANTNGPSRISFGAGGGSFDPPVDVYADTLAAVFDVEAADLDGDADLDLVFTRFGGTDLIFLNNGDRSFTFLGEVTPQAGESCVNCLAIADIDGDGFPDLIIAYNTGVERVEIFRGRGDATFEAPVTVAYGSLTPISVELADLDGDGDLDLAVGRSLTGGIFASLNNGDGAFAPLAEVATTTTSRCYGLGAADFDGDGAVDLLFSQDAAGVIALLPGKGDGTFDAQIALDDGASYSTSNIELGDVDGDGDIDALIGAADAPSVVFLGE